MESDSIWEEYYLSQDVYSFAENKTLYADALVETIFEGNRFEELSQKKEMTVLLGGFHSQNGTPGEFEKFLKPRFWNFSKRVIFLDKNPGPFESLGPRPGIQARLEDLPFQKSSLDLVFLDGTFHFMSQREISKFSASLGSVLKRNGLVFANILFSEDKQRMKELKKPFTKIGIQTRLADWKILAKATKHQELIFSKQKEDWRIMVFSHRFPT